MRVAVLDSGAGGRHITRVFRDAEVQAEFIPFGLFPLGAHSKEQIYQVVDSTVKAALELNFDRVFVGCNTASLVGYSHPRATFVLPNQLPASDSTVFPHADYILGSSYTASQFTNGINSSGAIHSIELWSQNLVTDNHLEVSLSGMLDHVPVGTKAIYLGCTHFAMVKHFISSLRPDLTLVEPDYLNLLLGYLP